MNLKAILFDLDGTLLDSVPIILRAAEEVFTAMDLAWDPVEIRKAIGIPLKTQARMFAGERADEFCERYRAIYRPYQNAHSRLFPGTLEMLDGIRRLGCLTAVVTSKVALMTHRAIEQTGMSGRFDAVVTIDDVTHAKPHPEPILKALAALDVRREEALYVGDSLFDMDAAQRARVATVGVTWGARSREDLLASSPAAVVDSWRQFLEWIPRNNSCSA